MRTPATKHAARQLRLNEEFSRVRKCLPATAHGGSASGLSNMSIDQSSGASKLSKEQVAFLRFAESPGVKLADLIEEVESMSPPLGVRTPPK